MDIGVYVSQLQGRAFIALAGIICALLLETLRGVALGHRADPRPLLERLADMLLTPFIQKLNRPDRTQGALMMRGFVITLIGCFVFYVLMSYAMKFAHIEGQGGPLITLFLMFSVCAVGWFTPMRALMRVIGDAKAPRPYMVLARASYTNMVTLDDSGIIRVSVTAALRSLTIRLAAPILLFVIFGWQVLAIYWPVMAVALIAGQDGQSKGFAAFANLMAAFMLFLPTMLMFPVVLAALFFSAGSSFFQALPGFFKVHRWPPFLQGGVPLLVTAYAMKLTLGGPRQDRAGMAVQSPWIGSNKGTAKLETGDAGRVLYLQAVTLLLFSGALFFIAVI